MPSSENALRARFIEELHFLRSMGERFQADHRDVAANLQLSGKICPDPHVERLIESFAFLTARLRLDLEDDFSEIAAELLRILYPHYLNPLPSMTIVKFEPGEAPATILREKELFIRTDEDAVCRFRTCYDTKVWPIEVDSVRVEHVSDFGEMPGRNPNAAVLRIGLKAAKPFAELGVDTLRFFVDDKAILGKLYPLLHCGDCRRVAAVAPGSRALPAVDLLHVSPVGFGDGEEVIPYPRLGHSAYRLLQEYFAFEQKFHFFDVSGLAGNLPGKQADLLIFLEDELPYATLLRPDTFVLGCTPAVNLFSQVSEPIRVSHRDFEHELVADYRRAGSTAIHSIVSVSGSSDAKQTSREYAPFYSFTHRMAEEGQAAFWHVRSEGETMFLSFRDADFDPALPADEVVYAHLLCTNGNVAHEIRPQAALHCDEDLSVAKIVALNQPTQPLPPPAGGDRLWRVVSHLSLNYLSIESTEESLRALQEILMLYCPPEVPLAWQRIAGIKEIASRKVMHRAAGWQGFVRGTEVTLRFGDELMSENYWLFALVLSQFLALHSSINSMSRLVVTDEHGKGLSCPWMSGGRAVL